MNACSEQQVREYRSQLLDHRAELMRWADRWYYLCGPREAAK